MGTMKSATEIAELLKVCAENLIQIANMIGACGEIQSVIEHKRDTDVRETLKDVTIETPDNMFKTEIPTLESIQAIAGGYAKKGYGLDVKSIVMRYSTDGKISGIAEHNFGEVYAEIVSLGYNPDGSMKPEFADILARRKQK